MTLIWSEGLPDALRPAPLLLRRRRAEADGRNVTLPAEVRLAAREEAEALTASLAEADEAALGAAKQAATNKTPRTHALVVGVGQYDAPGIPALTTSVHGAVHFAEWLLSEFDYARRPLGSVELLLSHAPAQEWKPSDVAAARLGAGAGEAVPVGAATFANVEDAFTRWLARAGAHHDNAAFLYFAGHGLWKGNPFLLPQDARIADAAGPFRSLIDIQQTLADMFNAEPGIQCFFVDACQEFTVALQRNLDATPGTPLGGVRNAPLVKRDACLFLGSEEGNFAYGPSDDAPFFTQELLACFRRRGADANPVGGKWRVTTGSLHRALDAAGKMRAEAEKKEVAFTLVRPKASFEAELYRFAGPPEVFVQVVCDPRTATGKAALFIEAGGARVRRVGPRADEWYAAVPQGAFRAGAEFEGAALLAAAPADFHAQPTVFPVELTVSEVAPGGGGGGTGG